MVFQKDLDTLGTTKSSPTKKIEEDNLQKYSQKVEPERLELIDMVISAEELNLNGSGKEDFGQNVYQTAHIKLCTNCEKEISERGFDNGYKKYHQRKTENISKDV